MTVKDAAGGLVHGSVWAPVCRRLSSTGLVSWFGRTVRRRSLVVGFGLVVAAFPLIGWWSGEAWIVMVLLIPHAAASLLLAATTQYLFDRPMSSLDERQRHIRQTLFVNPYMVGATLGMLGGLVVAWGLTAGNDGVVLGWLFAVLGFVFGYPSMVLAWTLEDEVDDGE